MTEELFIREWHNSTVVHPLGFAALLMLGTLLLFVQRRWAIVPILLLICFIPTAQRISPVTLDFHFLRIMVLIGWVRVLWRGELRGFQWKGLDTCVMAWAVIAALVHIAGRGTLDAAINRAGFVYDAIGMYFLFRVLMRDWDDVLTIARAAACISVPVAIAFLIERGTGRNMFSIFGGVPELTVVREGKLRCQGAFSHPILAGSFWAALLPLMLALWTRSATDRVLAIIGSICGAAIIFACGSSTPIIACAIVLIGCGLYFARAYMPWIRFAIIPALIALHLVMIAPIWHLLSRLTIVPGSTGYYRFRLFDDFITNFPEWWLFGTDSVLHWWVYANGDVTNMYVHQGVLGGLLGLMLFVGMIIMALLTLMRIRQRTERTQRMRFVSWALGVSLTVHCAVFMAVSYFGQIDMLWYLGLAMIGSLAPSMPAFMVRVRTHPATALSDNHEPDRAPGQLAT